MWTEKEREKTLASQKRFEEAMENHPVGLKGQVIAIDFKKGVVVKSKCQEGEYLEEEVA